MLSSGQWHKSVPKDPIKNVRFRLALMERARGARAFQICLLRICEQDILFFINVFVWQLNPKQVNNELGPFITWDFQDDLVLDTLDRLFVQQDDMLWEKSREMGATWLALIIWDWMSLFHSWKKFLCLSHSEMAVDRPADPDSLFFKVQFMHDHLPSWLLRGAKKRKLGFSYPSTHSSMNGQASTARSGVGGRCTGLLADEFSKQQAAAEILGQTADTGPRLFVGTHYGIGTTFHILTERPDLHKRVLHWSQHPEKKKGLYRYNVGENKIDVLDKSYVYPLDFKFVMTEEPVNGPFPGIRSPWYDRECERRQDSRQVALHLDIAPMGGQSEFFNPLTIRVLRTTFARPPVWQGDVGCDRETGRPVGLVEVPDGPLKLWVRPRHDGTIPLGKYGAGADLSAGQGATNTCLSLTSADSGDKVAEYATARIDPLAFAPIATAICWLFKDEYGQPAFFAWEHAGPGQAFGNKVVALGYPRIYCREDVTALVKGKSGKIAGWYPSNETKGVLLTEYRNALNMREFMNHSDIALSECLPYRYDAKSGYVTHPHDVRNDDPTGARSNHGDRVIADALSWLACQKLGIMPKAERRADKIPVLSFEWRRQLAERAAADREEWVEVGA